MRSLLSTPLLSFLFLVTTGLSVSASAQDDRALIADLSDQWLIYDASRDIYVPFLTSSGAEIHSLSFQVDLSRHSGYYLYVAAPAETALFIDQQIVDYISNSRSFSVDSLRAAYGRETLFLTLYHKDLGDKLAAVRTFVAAGAPAAQAPQQLASASGGAEFERRPQSAFHDYFVFGLIILLIFYAALINVFPKRFRSYYDFSRTLSLNVREESIFKGKIFDGVNTPALFAHSALIAFTGLALFGHIDDRFSFTHFGSSVGYWGLITLAIFIFYVLKYWLLSVVGALFNMPVVNRHYLEYLRMSKIFFAILFIIVVGAYLGLEKEMNNIRPFVTNLIIIFLIIRVLLLYFKFINASSFKNLYLFSYLCSTEILPLIIGIRILV